MPCLRTLAAAASLLGTGAMTGCTTHHGARAEAQDSAKAICERHYPRTTVAADMTVADARFIGGPRTTTPEPGPLDTYSAQDRVVRCLVPRGQPAGTADVVDIVEPADRAYVRWTQGGSTTQIIPVS
jgi:hypothetical protein